MSAKMPDDQQIRRYLDEYEEKKGEYDKENYKNLKFVVDELKGFLEKDNAGGIFSIGKYLERTGLAVQEAGIQVWTNQETAKILTEALQKEASTEKGDA